MRVLKKMSDRCVFLIFGNVGPCSTELLLDQMKLCIIGLRIFHRLSAETMNLPANLLGRGFCSRFWDSFAQASQVLVFIK